MTKTVIIEVQFRIQHYVRIKKARYFDEFPIKPIYFRLWHISCIRLYETWARFGEVRPETPKGCSW